MLTYTAFFPNRFLMHSNTFIAMYWQYNAIIGIGIGINNYRLVVIGIEFTLLGSFLTCTFLTELGTKVGTKVEKKLKACQILSASSKEIFRYLRAKSYRQITYSTWLLR
jgi:hypothetical protein